MRIIILSYLLFFSLMNAHAKNVKNQKKMLEKKTTVEVENMAKEKKPANKMKQDSVVLRAQEAAQKLFLGALKTQAEVIKNYSVCGSDEADAIIIDVQIKKIGLDEKGNKKEIWQTVEKYSALVSEFEKSGVKALISDGHCPD